MKLVDPENGKEYRFYDTRMYPWENLRWKLWLPLVCAVRGHRWWCAKIVPATHTQEYVWWCKRCMLMEDYEESCGRCTNGCSY